MNYRRFLIRSFTFLGGIYFFLEFVLPEQVAGVRVDAYHDQISNGFIAVGSMALGLGLINLFMIHGSKIVFKRKGWINSAALLVGLLLMMAVTIAEWRASARLNGEADAFYRLRDFAERIVADHSAGRADVPPLAERQEKLAGAVHAALADLEERLSRSPHSAGLSPADAKKVGNYREELRSLFVKAQEVTAGIAAAEPSVSIAADRELVPLLARLGGLSKEYFTVFYEVSGTKHVYRFLFQGLFVSLGSAMFALLGFYIAAAAYRAFKVRSAESALMMGAALVVMLGQIPFGVWIWSEFPAVRLWLLQIPNAAAFRAIGIGAAVASLLMAFRMWFSLESESFTEET